MQLRSASIALVIVLILTSSCSKKSSSHDEMIGILKKVKRETSDTKNNFTPEWKLRYADSLLALPNSNPEARRFSQLLKANILLEAGMEPEAIALFEEIVSGDKEHQIEKGWKNLALAHMRAAERSNCVVNHASASCIIPVRGLGVHRDRSGSSDAIEIFREIVRTHPDDLESKWLLNIAYMTLGQYPANVPKDLLIPGMEGDTTVKVNAFEDIAGDLNLTVGNSAGGLIIDDFDDDGYLDIVTSGWALEEEMHFFKNMANGTYTDVSEKAGFKGITGGLHIQQIDYNNDGYNDIFVLRGAWKGEGGTEPNSLLRNNGDGSFTDVTTISGLVSFHPKQTAAWADYNKDGWLDVFIGNETMDEAIPHPAELYMNNQDGTFTEVAEVVGINFSLFIKAVTTGDYDNDGWQDIFISTMNGKKILLRNKGRKDGRVAFENVSAKAGLDKYTNSTFPAWFWDYDNDGWLDIYVCDYSFQESLAYYAAAEKLGIEAGSKDKMLLFHNNHDGTFTNLAPELGLNKVAFAMGSNFGDIDNDGYLDMYLGTGNVLYQSLVPNKMFKNMGGKAFADVTTSARVGHLQKGHGVAFADMDNDGDQDVYIEMGGAFRGDAYQNSFFLNPGQGTNNWITISLSGKTLNRSAIGSRVKLTFTENGVKRSVYRDVNSGGSFGSSPLRRELGIGQAKQIDELEIEWFPSGLKQTFNNIKPNQFLKITEGDKELEVVNLKTFTWTLPDRLCDPVNALKL